MGKLSGWGEKRRRSPQKGEWPETENRKARESKGLGRVVVVEREAAGKMGKERSSQDEFLAAWAWG